MKKVSVYIGTYSYGGSRGIYLSELDLDDATLSPARLVAEISDPGYLRYDAKRRVLFAIGNPAKESLFPATVASFAVKPDGGLSELSHTIIPKVKCCHIAVNTSYLFAAAYGAAAVVLFPIDSTGRISSASEVALIEYTKASAANPERQSEPHVHSFTPDYKGEYAFVCDFSMDCIRVYRLTDGASKLDCVSTAKVADGSGPRHLIQHPFLATIYVINELSGTIDAFNFEKGHLSPMQTISTLPEDFTGKNTAAEIVISPDGLWLYATNRGDDSIVYYRIDAKSGKLERMGWVATQGARPRNMIIDPSGHYMLVANRDSNNVAVFRMEEGTPTFTGNEIELSVPMGMAVV